MELEGQVAIITGAGRGIGHATALEPPPPAQPWADLPKVLTLAAYPNVAIKITGACTLAHDPFPYKDIWDQLGRIFEAYSFDRCLWGRVVPSTSPSKWHDPQLLQASFDALPLKSQSPRGARVQNRGDP